MKLEPTNRHILVNPLKVPEKESQSIIVLPQDYKKDLPPYKLCKVLDVAGDSKLLGSLHNGDTIIVEERMIQKIEVEQNEFYLILENYVLGRIKK